MSTKEKVIAVFFVVGLVALITFAVVALRARQADQAACIESGGVVHEYNCSYSGGSGYAARICDWQCVRQP